MSATVETPQIRVLGPYLFRDQYRCAIRNGHRKVYLSPEKTAERAMAVAERFVAELTASQPLTVGQAFDAYGEYKLTVKANKPRSIETTGYRLRRFFIEPGLAVHLLTPRRCASYYEKLTKQQSVDTHRATLSEARTFCNWLIKRNHLRTNPTAGIEPVGRRRKGKPQLRIDEARRWMVKAEELAAKGEAGAVVAMVALLMGLRAGEIIERTVRDLDDNGRRLWIPTSKTAAGKRSVKVPDNLQPHLLRLARDKLPTAYLFPGKKGGVPDLAWPRKWVKRICKLAKVPEVCAHSMRGLHATLAIEAGASPDVVARSLGHESASMTLSNYAVPGSAESASASKVQALLINTPH
jgi:integrase